MNEDLGDLRKMCRLLCIWYRSLLHFCLDCLKCRSVNLGLNQKLTESSDSPNHQAMCVCNRVACWSFILIVACTSFNRFFVKLLGSAYLTLISISPSLLSLFLPTPSLYFSLSLFPLFSLSHSLLFSFVRSRSLASIFRFASLLVSPDHV